MFVWRIRNFSVNLHDELRTIAMSSNIYLDMFLTFSKVGLFTIGGGYAMIPLVEKDVVDDNGWLQKEEFMDVLAIAQSAPGLFAVNMATYIGLKISESQKDIKGWLLGLVGSIGVAIPSIIVILLIAMFFQTFKENIWVERFFMGVRPAVVALIAAPCFRMMKTAKITVQNIWIPVVACVLISCFDVSPVWIVLAAIASGYVYGRVKK